MVSALLEGEAAMPQEKKCYTAGGERKKTIGLCKVLALEIYV
jgi:hypothetical protein